MAAAASRATAAYRYYPLDHGQIRLVQLLPWSTGTSVHCSIKHTSLKDAQDRFVALSYCWGDPSTTRTITVDGQKITVTQNLWSALSSIVQHHNLAQFYWIDALCIDQLNISERNEQVRMMSQIYTSAFVVYALLGPEDEETETAFKALSSVAEEDDDLDGAMFRSWTGRAREREKSLMGQASATTVEHLAARSYWERVWVIQEFTRARNLRLVCGSYSCDWTCLLDFEHAVEKIRHLAFSPSVGASNLMGSRASLEPAMWEDLPHHVDPRRKWERVYACLAIFSQAKCTDSRDRVFAMLGHPFIEAFDGAELKVDYNLTRAEVVLTTLEWFDKARSAEAEEDRLEMQESEQEFAGDLWQQLEAGVCQNGAEPSSKTFRLFRPWVLEQPSWDYGRLPREVRTEHGCLVDCTRPVFTYLLGLHEIHTGSERGMSVFAPGTCSSGPHGVIGTRQA